MAFASGIERQSFLESLSDGEWKNARHQILECFETELRCRSQGYSAEDSECFENLYHAALYLHMLADVRDSVLIHDAKFSDFDLSCGMDYQYMLGAGLNQTRAHAASIGRHDMVGYLDSLADDPDIDAIGDWLEFRRNYFGIQR